MECSCDFGVDVEGFEKVFADEKIKSAKNCHCKECGRTIITGEDYHLFVGVDSGIVYIINTCLDCRSAIDVFFGNGGYYVGMAWDCIREGFEDCDFNIPESCISSLTTVARARVCNMIEDHWSKEEGE